MQQTSSEQLTQEPPSSLRLSLQILIFLHLGKEPHEFPQFQSEGWSSIKPVDYAVASDYLELRYIPQPAGDELPPFVPARGRRVHSITAYVELPSSLCPSEELPSSFRPSPKSQSFLRPYLGQPIPFCHIVEPLSSLGPRLKEPNLNLEKILSSQPETTSSLHPSMEPPSSL